ncbi:MAG: hypothetical protein H6807_06230 [Planctomycetes bacterium]|nr:hypothetical protein [Planctomycetota bacterium]
MMPPECEVCDQPFDPGPGGDLVLFSNHRPLPEGEVGHPPGCGWFCARHLEAARALTHLDLAEARRRLRAAEA